MKDNAAILKWLGSNLSEFNLPFSFQVPLNYAPEIWKKTANEYQRIILNDGMNIYDGAIAQIMWMTSGRLDLAESMIDIFLNSSLGSYAKNSLRAYYNPSDPLEHPFLYQEQEYQNISGSETGRRGLLFSFIDARGRFLTKDPLTGATMQWSDWVPKIGENAWGGGIGPLQVYYSKYGLTENPNAKELILAREIARAGILLQAENGGLRMSPKGTSSGGGPDYYYIQSTENNVSFYAHLRMLYYITQDGRYKVFQDKIEEYFKASFNVKANYFCRGMHFIDEWIKDNIFASDVQTWSIMSLGPEKIDKWFGEGTAYKILLETVEKAGAYKNGKLIGLDFTDYRNINRQAVVFPEQSFMFCSAAMFAAQYYAASHPDWSESLTEMSSMIDEGLAKEMLLEDGKMSYSYSSVGGVFTGHGWFSPPDAGPEPEKKVQSLSSTGWAYFYGMRNDEMKAGFNPFWLGGKP